MTERRSDEELREAWREGLRSTGTAPELSDHDRYNTGITAGLRAVYAAGVADTVPDREAVARIIDPRAWREPLLPDTYREGDRLASLAKAAAVLALLMGGEKP